MTDFLLDPVQGRLHLQKNVSVTPWYGIPISNRDLIRIKVLAEIRDTIAPREPRESSDAHRHDCSCHDDGCFLHFCHHIVLGGPPNAGNDEIGARLS